MMAAGASPPPVLPGLTVGPRLGGGGFADVYLYEQQALGRKVAVKVLREHASTEDVQRQFRAEAMLMAALSDHQNIVTIHDAAIAPDGRPYLVMAYCPGRNLSERYKSEQIGVAETLSIGIQLAGAIETAHRQQILHRDIKPANVLTTAAGRPALTDFGISVSTDSSADAGLVGMSIPWSPPEMLSDEPTGDARADVYSLAATLYSLLARRSPYELSGRSNDQIDLIHRIERVPLTTTGRADVAPSVERVLARAMAKNPSGRYHSALEFARALQQLEGELGGAITPVDISAEDPVAAAAEIGSGDDGRTRIRPLITIHAQGTDTGTRARDHSAFAPNPERTMVRPPRPAGSASVEHTQVRGPASSRPYLAAGYLEPPPPPADTQVRPGQAEPDAEPPAPRRSRVPLLASAAALVVVAVVTTVLLTRGTGAPAAPTAARTASASANVVLVHVVPEPVGLTGKVSGHDLVFSWKNPDPRAGDSYRWMRTDTADSSSSADTKRTTATVTGTTHACVQVELIRADSTVSAPAKSCFPES